MLHPTHNAYHRQNLLTTSDHNAYFLFHTFPMLTASQKMVITMITSLTNLGSKSQKMVIIFWLTLVPRKCTMIISWLTLVPSLPPPLSFAGCCSPQTSPGDKNEKSEMRKVRCFPKHMKLITIFNCHWNMVLKPASRESSCRGARSLTRAFDSAPWTKPIIKERQPQWQWGRMIYCGNSDRLKDLEGCGGNWDDC